VGYYDAIVSPVIAVLGAALLAVGTAPSPSPVPESAEARRVVRAIEERHARSAGLTARFVQVYRSGLLGREVRERGVVSIKPPGRMRWEYKEPEAKTFVSDGRTFYFYVPADRQVIVRQQDDQRSIPSLLLSGQGDVLGQFAAELLASPAPGVRRLRLTPRQPEPEIERVTVDVEDSGRIQQIEVEDAQGNRSRFRFEDVREDARLPDKLFRFEVPRGVEVIQG
jgi:outer membrane lipoprotein carrier protein